MTSGTKKTQGRERLTREARRNLILDAAAAVFGAKGFDASRMEDVATEAGIAKGLLYKHFESKDALFEALVDREGRGYVGELRGALAAADVAERPFEALGQGLTVWLRQVAEGEATFQLADPGGHDAYEELRDRMREVIAEALLQVEPDVDRRFAWLVAAAVQGAAESVGVAWRRQADPIGHEDALNLLTMFCWGGLTGLQQAIEQATPEPGTAD